MAQNDILPAKFLLANIYDYSAANPRDYNFIAIGSGPQNEPNHYADITKFTPAQDQILPKFLLDEILNPEKKDRTFRIVHIEKRFMDFIPFLHEYFAWKSKLMGINFQFDDSEEMTIWRSEDHRIEIIFVFTYMYHGNDQQFLTVNNYTDDTWFLDKMVETTLHNKNKIVIMEFSGHSVERTRKIIYNNYKKIPEKKKLFLDNVLMYDECHCGMGIDTYSPLLKHDGSFYQFPLYEYDDMIAFIGTDDRITNILKNYFLSDYKTNLSKHHINYTRKFKGDSLMYNFPEYNEYSSPDEIMSILIANLKNTIKIIDLLHFVTPSIMEQINELFTNYKSYDVHKWRITMNKMFD
jgi:hypothetical protein